MAAFFQNRIFTNAALLIFILQVFLVANLVANTDNSETNDKSLFMRVLGLQKDTSEEQMGEADEEWPIRLAARAEMANWGTNSDELYSKIEAYLAILRPKLRKILAVKNAIDSGKFRIKSKFVEIGISCGIICASTLKLMIGVKKGPRWTYPFLGLQFSAQPPEDVIQFGVAAQFGVGELNLNQKDSAAFMSTVEDPHASDNRPTTYRLASFPVGRYKMDTVSSGGEYNGQGVTFGIMGIRAQSSHVNVNLLPAIPVYKYNFESLIALQLQQIIEAFYRFDFEQVEAGLTAFGNLVDKIGQDLTERGVDLSSGIIQSPSPLNSRHPFSSPGVLFSPPVIARYARKMLPTSMLERARCQGFLSDKATNPKSEALTLLQGG